MYRFDEEDEKSAKDYIQLFDGENRTAKTNMCKLCDSVLSDA